MKLLKLAVLPPDDANRARHRTHHDGFSLDEMPAKFDAGHQSTGGNAGGGKQAIATYYILARKDLLRGGYAHSGSALALLVGVEHQAALHLAADTAQCRCRQY